MGLVPQHLAEEIIALEERIDEECRQSYTMGSDDALHDVFACIEAVSLDKTLELKRSTLVDEVRKKLRGVYGRSI